MALPGLVAAKNLVDVADRERAWDNLGLNIERDRRILNVAIGDPFEGGYFAGYISHTADGNPTHGLIVAPAATGATGTGYTGSNLAWSITSSNVSGTSSLYDGAANTAAMVTAGIANFPAAEFCVNLNIFGYNDWYLPARAELQIAYINLKPTTAANSTTTGINNYSVPILSENYTSSEPARTNVALFTGTEAFYAERHRSSSQVDGSRAWLVLFNSGGIIGSGSAQALKSNAMSIRAFRRIAL